MLRTYDISIMTQAPSLVIGTLPFSLPAQVPPNSATSFSSSLTLEQTETWIESKYHTLRTHTEWAHGIDYRTIVFNPQFVKLTESKV